MARYAEDAWFAGFVDGEGCFGIYPNRTSMGGLQPSFHLGLRADDVGVIQELQAEFGGSWHIRPRRGWSQPICEWVISSKADMAHLIRYLERFPLRAKKARDFAIWREAVRAYARSGRHAQELPDLRAALQQVRVYDPEKPEVVVEPSPQLRLVEEL